MTNPKIILVNTFLVSCIIGFSQPASKSIRPKIQNLANRLAKDETVHLGLPVGFAGTPETKNKYYKLYKKLEAKSTDDELVVLTKNVNKTIVLYSFTILSSRGYVNLKGIFLENRNDTTNVWFAAGCTGSVTKVNAYMLNSLDPKYASPDKAYMTKSEFESYSALINQW